MSTAPHFALGEATSPSLVRAGVGGKPSRHLPPAICHLPPARLCRAPLLSLAFATMLCWWLGADTKPPKVDNFPRNALRGAVEAIRLPDKGGWELRYHKTDKVDLRANFPTFALAREEILCGMEEAGLTAEELEAARKDLDALEQSMGGTP